MIRATIVTYVEVEFEDDGVNDQHDQALDAYFDRKIIAGTETVECANWYEVDDDS